LELSTDKIQVIKNLIYMHLCDYGQMKVITGMFTTRPLKYGIFRIYEINIA